jgi:hypothetical protein
MPVSLPLLNSEHSLIVKWILIFEWIICDENDCYFWKNLICFFTKGSQWIIKYYRYENQGHIRMADQSPRKDWNSCRRYGLISFHQRKYTLLIWRSTRLKHSCTIQCDRICRYGLGEADPMIQFSTYVILQSKGDHCHLSEQIQT